VHDPVKSILIVGGGTAGWMAAAFLSRTVGPETTITLVESETIGRIGVGEASFNSLKSFFDYIGVSELEWMPACQATYKQAIRFQGWTADGGHFYHPFQRTGDVGGASLMEWWLALRPDEQFDYACFNESAVCDAQRAPRYLDGTVWDRSWTAPYAYHFDAALLAGFLRAKATAKGVAHRTGDVVGATLDARGGIDAVQLAGGESLSADLYLDCTGFRALLIEQTLDEPWISYADSLLCDRAFAIRWQRRPDDGINPYTTATALTAGWAWDIPLFSRTSTGYVYSSAHLDEEQAAAELRKLNAGRVAEEDGRVVKFRVGRHRASWVRNCVAVGLSSGFVEPLESTGLFFIQNALAELAAHFPDRSFDEDVIRNYNTVVGRVLDAIRDFLILHYCAGDRDDTPFWRDARADARIGDELAERLSLWRKRLPSPSNVPAFTHGFYPYSYAVMLLGLKALPGGGAPILRGLDPSYARQAFATNGQRTRWLVGSLPSHEEYLEALYRRAGALAGEEDVPASAGAAVG